MLFGLPGWPQSVSLLAADSVSEQFFKPTVMIYTLAAAHTKVILIRNDSFHLGEINNSIKTQGNR